MQGCQVSGHLSAQTRIYHSLHSCLGRKSQYQISLLFHRSLFHPGRKKELTFVLVICTHHHHNHKMRVLITGYGRLYIFSTNIIIARVLEFTALYVAWAVPNFRSNVLLRLAKIQLAQLAKLQSNWLRKLPIQVATGQKASQVLVTQLANLLVGQVRMQRDSPRPEISLLNLCIVCISFYISTCVITLCLQSISVCVLVLYHPVLC